MSFKRSCLANIRQDARLVNEWLRLKLDVERVEGRLIWAWSHVTRPQSWSRSSNQVQPGTVTFLWEALLPLTCRAWAEVLGRYNRVQLKIEV